jgi:hypothetical protein
MNKSILSFLSLLFLINCMTFAQNDTKGKFDKVFFGARFGVNVSSLSDGSFKYTGGKIGLNAGLYGGYYVTNNITVSFEPMYSGIGASNVNPKSIYYTPELELEKTYPYTIKERDIRIHAINLPIIAAYNFQLGEVSPKFFAGFSLDLFNWKYSQYDREVKNPSTNKSQLTATSTPINERFFDYDYSTIIGGGVNFKINQFVMSFDLRATFGISNINATEISQNFFNRSLAATIGFGF